MIFPATQMILFSENILKKIKPDYVIHLAAQRFVSRGVEDPSETYSQNIIGTLNMLNLSSKYTSGVFLNFTTDKVYYNLNSKKSFKETVNGLALIKSCGIADSISSVVIFSLMALSILRIPILN